MGNHNQYTPSGLASLSNRIVIIISESIPNNVYGRLGVRDWIIIPVGQLSWQADGQSGWVYTGYGVEILGNQSDCLAGHVPTQVLDYQVPSTLASAPIYVPTVQSITTGSTPVPASTVDCVGGDCVSAYQRDVYDGFVNRFISVYKRSPTIQEILGIVVYQEWFTTLGGVATANQYLMEGLSRNYYSDCKYNVCTPGELMVFLGGYQRWRIASPSNLASAVDDLMHDPYGYTGYLKNRSAVDTLVNSIYYPQPSSPLWVLGAISDRPWQWFTYYAQYCPNGSGRSVGNGSTQTLDKIPITARDGSKTFFEIYTYAQNIDLNQHSGPCKNQ